MAAPAAHDDDSDDGMDAFIDRFKTEKYANAFNPDNWEEEFEKVPMFATSVPEVIDPNTHPELACLQAIIHDDDRTPDEKAISLKDEGNAYFKEKNYKKAVISYTAGLKLNSSDQDIHVILLTNRAAAHFYLGNMRSALNDAVAAKKIKPDHIKALIRGVQCCIELHNHAEALRWCDEGLRVHPTDKKLQELRTNADKQKRAAERDARKAFVKEKKERSQKGALLAAMKERGVKLLEPEQRPKHSSDSEDEERGCSEQGFDGLPAQEATGYRVSMDQQGCLHWPVLFLYPEHQQTDFISAFSEASSFLDHLAIMFGEELPPWDSDRKYLPENLLLFFEDVENESLYQVNLEMPLLQVLQHKRYFIKAGSPSFIVLVKGSSFYKQYLKGKKVYLL